MPFLRTARRTAKPVAMTLPPGVPAAVRTRDTELLLEALAPLLTPHADSIRGAHKFELYKAAEASLTDSALAIDWAVELSRRPEPIAKQFAAHLVVQHPEAFDEHADAILSVLEACADDANWEVRETAGGVLGRFVVERPSDIAMVLRRWTGAPSANLRRAVVLALKYAVRDVPERADEFLDLLDPLMYDGDEYVRKNLGPFALGDGLLRVAPAPTLRRLSKWARVKDEWVRWNVASAFTSAEARKHAEAALPVLRIVAGDDHPMVARAVVRALVNLASADRREVTRGLASWGEDPARRAAVEAVRSRLHGRSS